MVQLSLNILYLYIHGLFPYNHHFTATKYIQNNLRNKHGLNKSY